MIVNSLGIPMMFPITWEENVASNMTRIPLFELFPGLMVSDLYKAYREGVTNGKIAPWDPNSPSDYVIGYVSDTTGKTADIVRDFFDALIKTIAAGKAPAAALLAKAETGIFEKTTTAAASTVRAAKLPLGAAAIIAVSAAAIYALSVLRPVFFRGNK